MKTITIYIFHKPSDGFYTESNAKVFGKKAGEPYGDNTRVFNSRDEAHQYACSYECSNNGNGTFSSSYDKYIKPMTITIE